MHSAPQCITIPIIYQSGKCLTTGEPILIPHHPNSIGVIHSMGLDKCIMTFIFIFYFAFYFLKHR